MRFCADLLHLEQRPALHQHLSLCEFLLVEARARGELAEHEHLDRLVRVRAAGGQGVVLVLEFPVRNGVELLVREAVEFLSCSYASVSTPSMEIWGTVCKLYTLGSMDLVRVSLLSVILVYLPRRLCHPFVPLGLPLFSPSHFCLLWGCFGLCAGGLRSSGSSGRLGRCRFLRW
jgi:hypothetical protein